MWDRALAGFFEETAKLAGAGKVQAAGNWVVNDRPREFGSARVAIANSRVTLARIAALVKLLDAGTLLTSAAKETLRRLLGAM